MANPEMSMNNPIESHGSLAASWFQTIHRGISSATMPGQARNATSARRNIGLASRPEIGSDLADACQPGPVRFVARGFGQCRAVPLLHRRQRTKLRGITLRRYIDGRLVGLDAEGHGRIERVDRAEARAGEERPAEAVESVGPQFFEAREIALQGGR